MYHFVCCICTVSFLSYYDIGCTMFSKHIYSFSDFCTRKFLNWCDKSIYCFGFWFPLGKGGCACVGMVCSHCVVHILNLSKNTLASALYQIRALENAFKQQNNGQRVPTIFTCYFSQMPSSRLKCGKSWGTCPQVGLSAQLCASHC